MQAVVKATPGPGFTVMDVPPPRPGPGQVLLRVVAASVCGSDVHLHDWNPWAAARVRPPRVMGHEICAEVAEIPDGVDCPPVGTRVAVESHLVCNHCAECERGDRHVCAHTRIIGVHVDGGFASHVVLPPQNLWPITTSISPEVAAALEPLGNAVHACSYGSLRGQVVVVFGCGPIGCAAVAIARSEGAEQVIAVDRNPYRLGLADVMGAHTLLEVGADPLEDLVRRSARGPIDCALEMSGASSAVVAATRAVRAGGWISLLGIGDEPTTLDVSADVVSKGLTLHGVIGRRMFASWERATELVIRGQVDMNRLITHHLSLDRIADAIALMRSGRCGKVSLSVAA